MKDIYSPLKWIRKNENILFSGVVEDEQFGGIIESPFL